MRFKAAFVSIAIVLAGGLLVLIGFGQMATQPTPYDVPQIADNEVTLTIKTSDGVTLAGSYFPTDKKDSPAVLLLHGNGASRGQFTRHIGWLNAAGYAAFVIDFRGHGESDPERKSFGWTEGRDAKAALTWLRTKHKGQKIGVIGISLGGAAALLGDGKPINADAMILQAVYPDLKRAIGNRITAHAGSVLGGVITPFLTHQSRFRFGVAPDNVSPVTAAGKFDRPVLVIGSEADIYTPPKESKELANAFPGKHWLWIVGELGHGQISGLNDAEYQRRVLLFFDETLRN